MYSVEELADAEVISDAVLLDESVGMSREEIRRLRVALQERDEDRLRYAPSHTKPESGGGGGGGDASSGGHGITFI